MSNDIQLKNEREREIYRAGAAKMRTILANELLLAGAKNWSAAFRHTWDKEHFGPDPINKTTARSK